MTFENHSAMSIDSQFIRDDLTAYAPLKVKRPVADAELGLVPPIEGKVRDHFGNDGAQMHKALVLIFRCPVV